MLDFLKNLSLSNLVTVSNNKITAIQLPVTNKSVSLEYDDNGTISNVVDDSTSEKVEVIDTLSVNESVYNKEVSDEEPEPDFPIEEEEVEEVVEEDTADEEVIEEDIPVDPVDEEVEDSDDESDESDKEEV